MSRAIQIPPAVGTSTHSREYVVRKKTVGGVVCLSNNEDYYKHVIGVRWGDSSCEYREVLKFPGVTTKKDLAEEYKSKAKMNAAPTNTLLIGEDVHYPNGYFNQSNWEYSPDRDPFGEIMDDASFQELMGVMMEPEGRLVTKCCWTGEPPYGNTTPAPLKALVLYGQHSIFSDESGKAFADMLKTNTVLETVAFIEALCMIRVEEPRMPDGYMVHRYPQPHVKHGFSMKSLLAIYKALLENPDHSLKVLEIPNVSYNSKELSKEDITTMVDTKRKIAALLKKSPSSGCC